MAENYERPHAENAKRKTIQNHEISAKHLARGAIHKAKKTTQRIITTRAVIIKNNAMITNQNTIAQPTTKISHQVNPQNKIIQAVILALKALKSGQTE